MRLVRAAKAGDLGVVADLHLAVFPSSFLTQLGRRFVLQMYQSFLERPRACFLVCCVDGVIVGFAVGLPSGESRNWQLAVRHLAAFALASLEAFFRSPVVVAKRLINRFLSADGEPKHDHRSFVLRSIGVDSRHRGSGVARELLIALEGAAVDGKSRSVVLTTDALHNDVAVAFYARMGYRTIGEFFQDGQRRMLVLEKPLA